VEAIRHSTFDTMHLAMMFLFVLLLLTVLWIVLAAKGVDPLRLMRSAFKSPQHHLTPSSYAEREGLLHQKQFVPPGARTSQTLLYSSTMTSLMDTQEVPAIEEILQFLFTAQLVNSDVKAQHFAQYCQRKVPLHALSPAALSVVITMLYRYVKFQIVVDCVQRCFEATSGLDCLQLKYELERHVSIHRLVFYHIQLPTVREAIAQHLEQEAAMLLETPAFVRPVKLLWYVHDTAWMVHLYVVSNGLDCSDIDDTMISVLFDTRYPDLTVYPGVHQFVEELLHCSSNDIVAPATAVVEGESSASSTERKAGSRITFLTARPEIMRRRSISQLRASGFFRFNCTYTTAPSLHLSITVTH
jgi:hypothetical protein